MAFTIDAAASSVCTITAGVVSFTGVGTCTVNADQIGGGSYNAAPQVPQSFTVAKGDQIINFASPPPTTATVGGPTYTPLVTASSGLPVALSINAPAGSVCSLSAGVVSFTGGGTCTINANQVGSVNYNPAPQVQQSFAVAKAEQTITFNALGGKVYGDADFTVSATGGATANPVTFTSQTAGVCSVTGATVHINSVGTCTVRASQAGNSNYNLATMDQSFTITPRPVTVTADAKIKAFGAADPALTYGLTSGSLITGDVFTGSLSRTAGTSAGTYPINLGTLALNPNYAITYVGANLTISPLTPFNLTTSLSPGAGGGVLSPNGINSYSPGSKVTVTVSPAAGYYVSRWTVTGGSYTVKSPTSIEVTLTADTTVSTAMGSGIIPTYKVTSVTNPVTAGRVTQVPGSALGYAKVVYGGSALFKAGANFGYAITGVTSTVGTLGAVAPDGTFTLSGITGDGAVTVAYARIPGAISTVLTPGTQTVAGTGPGNRATFTAITTVSPSGSYPAAVYNWLVTHTDGSPAPEATLVSSPGSPNATLTTTAYGTYSVSAIVSITVGTTTVSSNYYAATATFQAAK